MENYKLVDIIKILWYHIWVIILATIVFAASAFAYCYFLVSPVYAANAKISCATGIFDSTTSQTISTSEVSTSFSLMASFSELLDTSNEYYTTVTNKVNNGDYGAVSKTYTYNDIEKMASFTFSKDNIFINIKATSTVPDDAIIIVNALADNASDCITQFVSEKVKVKVVNGSEKAVKTSPNIRNSMVWAGLLGAVCAAAVVIIIISMDKTIKNDEDAASRFNVPVLGAIPDFELYNDNIRKKGDGYNG